MPLRYSDRKRLAETGSLGDLQHEQVPDALALAVRSVIGTGASAQVATRFEENVENALIQHFGIGQSWVSRTA